MFSTLKSLVLSTLAITAIMTGGAVAGLVVHAAITGLLTGAPLLGTVSLVSCLTSLWVVFGSSSDDEE